MGAQHIYTAPQAKTKEAFAARHFQEIVMTRRTHSPASSPFFSRAHPTRRQLLLGAASVGAASLLAACGGGGDSPGDPGAANAESFTTGPITGFGSVIVGGVRFDDTTAIVISEDGVVLRGYRFRLGQVLEIDAGRINRAEMRSVALRIALGGALVGPVSNVDSAGSTVTLLGQTVLITSSTVFDTSIVGGLGGVTAGGVYEVHGLFDPANRRFVATRVDTAPGATEYRLRGVVSELDTTAKTFKIGSELINYAGVPNADVPTALANGQLVRVRLQTTQVNGAWVATALRHGVRAIEPRPEVHVEGVINAYTSPQAFEVNGLKVDASNARFPDGQAGVVLGARVEVEGAIVNGVLVATEVSLRERRDPMLRLLEFRGEMSNLNTTAKTFALRGLTISYAGSVTYRNGTEASLANGRQVEVKGTISLDRTRIDARVIEFRG